MRPADPGVHLDTVPAVPREAQVSRRYGTKREQHLEDVGLFQGLFFIGLILVICLLGWVTGS